MNKKISNWFYWVLGAGITATIALIALDIISLPDIFKPTSDDTVVAVQEGKLFLNDKDTELDGLLDEEGRITAAVLSPDKQEVCVLVETIAPTWLYHLRLRDGDIYEVNKVGLANNCVWSNDSSMIAFNNHTTDVSPVNVIVYSIEDKTQTNFTSELHMGDNIRVYSTPVWNDDDSKVLASYNKYDEAMNLLETKISEIEISTGDILDL